MSLKPCPFCGGEAETHEVGFPYHYWDVWCDGECFDHFCEKPTEAEAIAAWNSRAERTCKNVCKEWAKTSFAGAETSFCCSECGAHYYDYESYYAGLADADNEPIRTNICPNCGCKVVCE